MVQQLYEGVTIDRCPVCCGIWLDEGELAPILESRELKLGASARQQALAGAATGMPAHEKSSIEPCPKCSNPMHPMNWGPGSGVIVDRCVGHGLWFDGGEIEKIQAYHEHWEDLSGDAEFKKKTVKLLENEKAGFALTQEQALSKMGPLARAVMRLLSRVR